MQDIWLDYLDPYNQNSQITGYPTEKNPEILARIIKASSNPGDLVLDCFAGSGTTLEVASQLKRRWLGIDNSPHALATILRRFVHGPKPMGDFVSLRDTAPQQAELNWSFESDETLPADNQTHTLIDDFVLLAEPGNQPASTQPLGSLVELADWFDNKRS